MTARRPLLPAVLLIAGIVGAFRFAPNVRTADAIGLLACGALIGVSLVRLLMTLRAR